MVLFILLTIVSFLRTLFVILLVWYGFKMVMRFIAPRVVEKAAEKIVKNMQEKQNSQTRPGSRQGDVRVERTEKKEKQFKRDDGDYVDFEEID